MPKDLRHSFASPTSTTVEIVDFTSILMPTLPSAVRFCVCYVLNSYIYLIKLKSAKGGVAFKDGDKTTSPIVISNLSVDRTHFSKINNVGTATIASIVSP